MARNNARGWRAQDDITAAYMAQRNAEARAKGQPITTVDSSTQERYVRGADTPVLDSFSRRRYVQSDASAGWRAQDDITAAYMAALNAANRSRASDTEEKPTEEKEEEKKPFSPASSLEEFMGIVPYVDEQTLAENEWKRMGVDNAADYGRISRDYTSRGLTSGLLGAARDTVNFAGNTVQQGNKRFRIEQAAESAAEAAMYRGDTGGQTYEELYKKYLQEYTEKLNDDYTNEPLHDTVDWGRAYDEESERIAQELGVNEEARKDYQFNQAVGRMAPAIALSATGNLAGAGLTALGAKDAAQAAFTIGRVLSSASTFTSASGAAYEDAKANGVDDSDAMTYAAVVGAVELATEAISSGLGKIGGKNVGPGGVTDDALDRLAKRISADKDVQEAVLYIGSTLGEGFEEWLSEWGDYAANKLLVHYDDRNIKDVWGDSLESFQQGAMMSALLNTSRFLRLGKDPWGAIREGIDETAAEAGITNPDASPASAAVEATSPAASVMADILQNPVNRSQANRIINNTNLRAEYEAYTGETLPTVKSEAAKAVMEYSRNHAELTPIAQTVLGQRAEPAPISDVSTDTVSPAAQAMADVLTGKGPDAESTSVNTNPAEHTAVEQRVIDEYQNATDTGLVDFVQRAAQNPGGKERYTLNPVSDRAAADIKNITGVDTAGNQAVLESRMAEHILRRHGENGEADHSMRDINDIGRIQYVIDNYDSVVDGGTTQSYVTNVDGKNRPAKTVLFSKAVNGTYYVVEAVPDTTKHTTYIVTAYMTKNKPTGVQSPDAFAPAQTAKTEADLPVGTATVSQAAPTVNPASPDGTKLSRTVETVRDAGITPEPVKRDINTGIEEGKYRYIPESNDDAVSSARSKIAERGYESVLRDWTADVRSGKTGSDYTATGAILYNEALQSGNTRLALDILADYQQLGTNTAQGLQAFRIMKDLAPEDRLYMVQRSVDNLYNNLSDGAKKKLPDGLKIDETLAQEYVNAADAKSEAAALKNLQKDIAKQIPNTFADRFTALRYLNMLGNFRTQIRNLAGNTGMAVTAGVKNTVRYTLERAIEAVSGGKYQRNTSLVVHPDMMNAARADYDAHADFINGDAKYNDAMSSDSFARGVREERRVFTSNNPLANLLMKPADIGSRATNWAMKKGDTVFIKQQYARYLGGYLEAHKMDADTFSKIINGEIQPTAEQTQTIDNGRVFAAKEAQEATFHDTNAVSKWISQIGRKPGTPWLARMLSEGVAPFRKTPANVAVRAVEYSPLGFLDTAAKAVQAAKGKNGVSGADVINSLSKSLTGTGLFALGMVLRNAGWLRGKGDDEEQAAFEKLQGMQDYSLVLPDGTSVTMDWLSPAAIPMFMGVALADEINDGGFETSDVVDLLAHLTDPMIQMSMLQGVNDTLESVKYSGNSLGQVVLNIMLSYAMQGLTNTMLGQAERTFEDRRYSTFLDADNPTGKLLQSTLGKALAKTPGIDYNQVEYVDAWGRTEYSGSPAERAFENFLSPGYLSKQNSTEVDSELQRLYDAGQTNVFPQRVPMSQTVGVYRNDGRKLDDRALTKDEYVQYQKVMGQTSLELVKSLMRSPIYQGMSDESKAAAISEIYGYARRMAAMEVEPSAKFGERTDVSKLSNPAAYYAVTESYSTASKDSENRNYSELDALTSSFKRLPADVCNAVIDKNSGFEKLLDAKENGYNAQQYYRVYDSVKALTPAPGYVDVATWQKIVDVCSMSISDDQKDYFTGNYFQGSMHDKYMAARERGYSPYSVAVAYQTYSTTKGVDSNGDGRIDSGSKKKAFISAMMAQGASESSAEWLYKLFS